MTKTSLSSHRNFSVALLLFCLISSRPFSFHLFSSHLIFTLVFKFQLFLTLLCSSLLVSSSRLLFLTVFVSSRSLSTLSHLSFNSFHLSSTLLFLSYLIFSLFIKFHISPLSLLILSLLFHLSFLLSPITVTSFFVFSSQPFSFRLFSFLFSSSLIFSFLLCLCVSSHLFLALSCLMSPLLIYCCVASSLVSSFCLVYILSHFASSCTSLLISFFTSHFGLPFSSPLFFVSHSLSSPLVPSLLISSWLFCSLLHLIWTLPGRSSQHSHSFLLSFILKERHFFIYKTSHLLLPQRFAQSDVSPHTSRDVLGTLGRTQEGNKGKSSPVVCLCSSGLSVCVECVRRSKDTVIACLVHEAKSRR